MKKYFILSGTFLFIACAAFGVWKFELYKKFPAISERFPASETEELAQNTDVDQAIAETESENHPAETVVKDESEFKVKLQKVVKKSEHTAEPKVEHKVVAKAEHKTEQVVKSQPAVVAETKTDSVKHMVTKDETAWFLANVYYGKGQKFEEILAANGFSDPKEIREGREITIPSPKFHKGQSNFASHYSEVWEKRAQALKERNKPVDAAQYLIKAPMPASKVVLPTQKIRAKDKTPEFPFAEVKGPRKSPSEMAKEVLRQSGIPQE